MSDRKQLSLRSSIPGLRTESSPGVKTSYCLSLKVTTPGLTLALL